MIEEGLEELKSSKQEMEQLETAKKGKQTTK